MALLDPPDYF
jgi:hypothetical protein